jgi:cytochrome c oxidase cbb3-type subunit 2
MYNDEPQVVEELQRLINRTSMVSSSPIPPMDETEAKPATGMELYALHCGACHGPSGDGNGRAAGNLSPRPRNFRADRFRLVSTRNAVPSASDIAGVIQRGMPGTSMPAFRELNEQQRMQLADVVMTFHRQGLEERLRASLLDADPDAIRELVRQQTTSGESVPVPQLERGDTGAIERGDVLFHRVGCVQCHGDEKNSARPLFYDERGFALQGRDLVREPLKGGEEPEAIFLRLRLGMPGTAHPAIDNLSDEQLSDLVQYCRSLAREPKQTLTNFQRRLALFGLEPGRTGSPVAKGK